MIICIIIKKWAVLDHLFIFENTKNFWNFFNHLIFLLPKQFFLLLSQFLSIYNALHSYISTKSLYPIKFAFFPFPYNIQNKSIENIKKMSESSFQNKKYSKYTRQMRLNLIKLVDQEKLSTAHAAKIIGIKQTSACRILRSYRKYNRIFEKKDDRMQREKFQEGNQEQKSLHFQNVSFQQKKVENTSKISYNTPLIVQNYSQVNSHQNFLQNTLIFPNTFNIGNGMTVLYNQIISYNQRFQNVRPLTFGYF